jgi:hypothetical protein
MKPNELVIEGDAVGGANAEIAVDEFIIIYVEIWQNNSCRWFIP